MKKQTFLLVALLLMLGLLLTACGGGETNNGGNDANTGNTGNAGEENTGEEANTGDTPAEELTCDDAIGCVEIGPDDPIHIAYMLSISGATAFLGEDSRGGIEIAIDDRGGQLLDHDITLTGEDTLCNAEGGQSAAQKIAADTTIVGIIGTTCSSEAVAAMPTLSEAGMVMISPSNTSPRLTEPDAAKDGAYQPGYYRTAHNDLFQGRVAAEFAYNELGARKAATIHDGSPYADGLRQVFEEVFVELGGEITYSGAVNVGETNMSSVLTPIAANVPDLLYFPIFEPEGNFIAAQAREIEALAAVTLMGADGLQTDSFPEASGEAAVGMYLSGPAVAGEAYDAFLSKWTEKYGGNPPSGFHAHAYDATNILLDAIASVAQVGGDGTILIGRQALRDAITGTSGFEGLTGVLACNETGDCATGEALAIYQLTEAEVNGNWPPAVVWQP
ncbi:MAG: branched-chain amino acid ABC transporter substrate-binding protein [Chloroflexi bacterium]|nr:branched-chain amino acid ABC transporter substrate-binding protein [Chloroflexota bacterium]MBP8058994.1 branched-chain amino acid ABC transporter substrate-binding protein [Chloroflexota bacterium]